jgi:phosphosulfolactate phosphohydrolase-like enzyme
MVYGPVRIRAFVVVLSLLTIIVIAPFPMAAAIAAYPWDTALVAGDKIDSSQPALTDFDNGSPIEIRKATATFARHDKTLVAQTSQVLLGSSNGAKISRSALGNSNLKESMILITSLSRDRP